MQLKQKSASWGPCHLLSNATNPLLQHFFNV